MKSTVIDTYENSLRNCLAVDDLPWMAYSLFVDHTICSLRINNLYGTILDFIQKVTPSHLFSANVRFTCSITIDRNDDQMKE